MLSCIKVACSQRVFKCCRIVECVKDYQFTQGFSVHEHWDGVMLCGSKYFQFSKFLKSYAWHTKKRVLINWSGLIFINEATNMGRVKNTDPRSADYPLTPTPRTTIRTTPPTTLRTTLNNQPNLLFRRKEIQQTYLRYLRDRSTW